MTLKKVEISTSFEGIFFTVRVDKIEFTKGEIIKVDAEIQNKGIEIFTHKGSSNCDNTIYFSVMQNNQYSYLTGNGSIQPLLCFDDLQTFNLKPNQKIQKTAEFETQKLINVDNISKPLDSGEYLLVAKYGPISTNIKINIK